MKINAGSYEVSLIDNLKPLQDFLLDRYAGADKIIICDDHTLDKCLPVVDAGGVIELADAEVFQVEHGEGSKSIDIAEQIWLGLANMKAGRDAVVINIGGGVVSDLGGFVAATYKRGIDFINLPTTLLAMVDASVGGKTGINLDNHKNQVGVFCDPVAVFIYPEFLKTLPERELLSGWAEVIKHALIADAGLWEQIVHSGLTRGAAGEVLYRSIEIKNEIVQSDQREGGRRKLLNFGHTMGHAFEGLAAARGKDLLHGEAVAAGMICAAWLSAGLTGLPEADRDAIAGFLADGYRLENLRDFDYRDLKPFLENDKKNVSGEMMFTLLKSVGEGAYNIPVSHRQAEQSLEYFREVL